MWSILTFPSVEGGEKCDVMKHLRKDSCKERRFQQVKQKKNWQESEFEVGVEVTTGLNRIWYDSGLSPVKFR